METWDAYDKDFNKIHNATLIRGEAIPEGLFHLVCDIIVKHTDGSYLLMQRDRCKQFGGMWEATAGGSALQNESPLDCAIRELQEETGIRTDNLVEVGRERSNDTIYVEFLCVTNCNKDCIATVYKGNIIKNLIMDCQSYTKYRPNETTGGIFVSWRRKEELPTGA